MWVNNATRGLPAEYQEVEYIESTGTQYIDTGLFAYNNYQVETKIEITTSTQEKSIFGSFTNTSSSSATYQYYHMTSYQNKWYWGLNGSEGNGGSYGAVGTQYEIVYNNSNNKVIVNNSEIGNTNGTVGYSGSKLGISIRGSTNQRYYGVYKYFYFKVYDKSNGEYIRDMIPCYRKSDNVIGMYDLVNDQFYTNAGTGTFTKGADIPDMLEKQVRPTGESRNLFTETDLSTNSLGLLVAETTSWQGQYPRTLAGISNDGMGNYYYATQSYQPVCLRLRGNYPVLMTIPQGKTNRKIKVIYDYLAIMGSNSQCTCGRYNRDSGYAPCLNSAGDYNWGAAAANVVYTAEIIMDLSANTESGTIYLKSDGSKVRDFGPNTMPTSTSGSYYENDCWLGYGTDSASVSVRLGNVHIYYMDII